MADDLKELLETSIELELLVSDLYSLYADLFPEDKDFWWKLSMEEQNHASLLESGRAYLEKGILPEEAVFQNLDMLNKTKDRIQELIIHYKESAPSYEDAYYEAVKIESSAAELHYQLMMTRESDSKIIKIFQSLDGDDTDHAKRISDLLTQKVRGQDSDS